MKKLENECLGCATENYPCRGEICSYRHVPHYYCDNCGDEVDADELFKWNGQEYCLDCIHNDVESDLEKAYPNE